MQRILSLLQQRSLNTALRRISSPVPRSLLPAPSFRQLCADLIATLRSSDAWGLSAPQLGDNLRVIAIMCNTHHHRIITAQTAAAAALPQPRLSPLSAEPAPPHADYYDELMEAEETEELLSRSGHPVVMINPRITARSAFTSLKPESCLSVPSFVGNVRRPLCVDVSFTDSAGRAVELRLRGFDARVCQHEVEHLDGRLYIDRITQPDVNFTTIDHFVHCFHQHKGRKLEIM